MNALHIMYLYNHLKEDQDFYESFYPQTFIFGAKAAGSYFMAKKIIKLINTIADVVNNDSTVNEKPPAFLVRKFQESPGHILEHGVPEEEVYSEIQSPAICLHRRFVSAER